MAPLPYIVLIIVWLAYFGLHSLLASLWLKQQVARRWPGLMPAYRMLFNLAAMVLLIPPLYLIYRHPGPQLWRWEGAAALLANGIALLAIAGVVWSLRYYEGGEFLGTRQWRERRRSVDELESMHISPLHRYVRHPWYLLGMIVLWTRDMNLAMLFTALLLSGYFVVGSRLEERKLLRYHGERYRRYRERVPGLLPRPWRYLTRDEAERLLRGEPL